MTTLSCAQVRDMLPEWAAGNQPSGVALHLSACPDCRAEAELLSALRAVTPAAPPALEARVLRATRIRPAPRAWANARQLAFAATLVGAVIGGSLLVDVLTRQDDGLPSSETATAGSEVARILLPVLEDPALTGGSVLSNLTETELESLLARMES